MPSKAYKTFEYNLVDVSRLAEAYEELAPTGQGKRGLGHLTRSAIVTLCACWEQYAEDVIVEGVEWIRKRADTPNDLPHRVKHVLSEKVRTARHNLKPLELAGAGWREVYLGYAKSDVRNMHSPKAGNIQDLISDYLGVTAQLAAAWSCGKDSVNDFVDLRNSIAHEGRRGNRYTKFWEVQRAVDMIHKTVIETDNFVLDHLASQYPGRRPWNTKRQ